MFLEKLGTDLLSRLTGLLIEIALRLGIQTSDRHLFHSKRPLFCKTLSRFRLDYLLLGWLIHLDWVIDYSGDVFAHGANGCWPDSCWVRVELDCGHLSLPTTVAESL
jgi:hypothetical protein